MKKTNKIYGIGINDIDEPTKENGKNKPYYQTWISMLRRCYGDNDKCPTYKNVTVCWRWHRLSSFKRWFDKHYIEGWQLDKDLLSKIECKIYSPETCTFLPPKINKFIANKYSKNNQLPTGITYEENTNRYRASIHINGKDINLGRYKSINEAKIVYEKAREKQMQKLISVYKNSLSKKAVYALNHYKEKAA